MTNSSNQDQETQTPLLKGEGEEKVITYVNTRHQCGECMEPATRRHSYLLTNARRNPSSSGYGKDDISWCSDAEAFSCTDCETKVRNSPPAGMEWASTFQYEHMLLYWKKKGEEVKPRAS